MLVSPLVTTSPASGDKNNRLKSTLSPLSPPVTTKLFCMYERKIEKGLKVYVYIGRKEVGLQSGDSGDTIDFKGFFLSPLLLRGGDDVKGGDKFEAVTAQTKKGTQSDALTKAVVLSDCCGNRF